eukprot:TRINITY_DN29926_c0_g1_i1.p1 TRINITY_DN29926_c0_g1~~TRINITY_DN29926_c0_g1_i1.p1  ORF type:complete len:1625 (+),score=391.34 TRINITY_DN29926_c0_g1_i1:87-4961(+)
MWRYGVVAAVCAGVGAQAPACTRSAPIVLGPAVSGLTGELFQMGVARDVALGVGGQVELRGALVDNAGVLYIDGCETGVYFATPSGGVSVADLDSQFVPAGGWNVQMEGAFGAATRWVITYDGDYTTVVLAPGPPSQIRAVPQQVEVKLGYLLPDVEAVVTDHWGNPTPITMPIDVTAGCRYVGIHGYELYGQLTSVIPVSGAVTFANLIAKGQLGVCHVEFVSSHLLTWTAGKGEALEVKLAAGDPHEIRLVLRDPAQYEVNRADDAYMVATGMHVNLTMTVMDIGGNELPYRMCLKNPGVPVIGETQAPAFGTDWREDCVLLNVVWGDLARTAPPTGRDRLTVLNFESEEHSFVRLDTTLDPGHMTGRYDVDDVLGFWVPEFVGEVTLEARLRLMKTPVINRLVLQSTERGEFKCLNSSLGARLFTTNSINSLLDDTSTEAMTKTFFDPDIPPPPFVRFNISYMHPESYEHYYSLPAKFQYWVLMHSPFYVQLDPVLTTYFCFGFSYARVSDIFLYLRQPFCKDTTQEEVTPQLSSLLFDVGDASTRFHKSHPLDDNFQWMNFTGHVEEVSGLSICVGDRILTPATTGYNIDCCSREQGTCLQNNDTRLFHTLIIALLSLITTLSALMHTKYLLSCLKIPFNVCPAIEEMDSTRKGKVIFVHFLTPLFLFFSVVVNWSYVHHFHPLVILWLVELGSGSATWIVFFLRYHGGEAKAERLSRIYQLVFLQITFVSLWKLWAAFYWALPTVFLETRRALVPFICFAMMLIYCITKPGVISEFHHESLGLFSVSEVETLDMLCDAATTTAGFAVFLSAVVYSLGSLPVISDVHIFIAILIVVVATFILNLALFETLSTATRRMLQGTADTVAGYVGGSLGIPGVQKPPERDKKDRSGAHRSLKSEPSPPRTNTEVVLEAMQGLMRDKWGSGPLAAEDDVDAGTPDSKHKPLLKNEATTQLMAKVDSVRTKESHRSRKTTRFLDKLFGRDGSDAGTPSASPRSAGTPRAPSDRSSAVSNEAGFLNRLISASPQRTDPASVLQQIAACPPTDETIPTATTSPRVRRATHGGRMAKAPPVSFATDDAASLAPSVPGVPVLSLQAVAQETPCSAASPLAFSNFAGEAERILEVMDTAERATPPLRARGASRETEGNGVTTLRLRRSPIDPSDAPLGFHCMQGTLELEKVDQFTPAWFCGMHRCIGQQLLSVNGRSVRSVDDVRTAVRAAGPYSELVLCFSPYPCIASSPTVRVEARAARSQKNPLDPPKRIRTSEGLRQRSSRGGAAAFATPAPKEAPTRGLFESPLSTAPVSTPAPSGDEELPWMQVLSKQREAMQKQLHSQHNDPAACLSRQVLSHSEPAYVDDTDSHTTIQSQECGMSGSMRASHRRSPSPRPRSVRRSPPVPPRVGAVLPSGIVVGETYYGPLGEVLLTWARPAAEIPLPPAAALQEDNEPVPIGQPIDSFHRRSPTAQTALLSDRTLPDATPMTLPRSGSSRLRGDLAFQDIPRVGSEGSLQKIPSARSLKDYVMGAAGGSPTSPGKQRVAGKMVTNVVKYAPRLREHASQGLSPKSSGQHPTSAKEAFTSTARAVATGILEDAVMHVADELRHPRSREGHCRAASRDSASFDYI